MVEISFTNLQNSNYDNPNMKIILLLFNTQVWRHSEIQADNSLPALL